MKPSEIIKILGQRKDHSARDREVTSYAIGMLEGLEDAPELLGGEQTRELLFNDAVDWNQYSWGGCALVYDADIARALCTPSELRRTRCGERRPNVSEEWLDVQDRACAQACDRTLKAIAAAPVTVVVEYKRGGGEGGGVYEVGRGVTPKRGPRSPESCGGDPPRRFLCRNYILRGRAAPSPHPPRQGAVPLGTPFCHRKPVVQDKRALRACGATRLAGFRRVGQGHCAFEREL